jgi:hypothetical protein
MAKYKIHRWDPVVFGNNTHPFPTIYIKPDQTFIDFAAKNQNSVIVKIDGTNTIYDGKAMVGIVSPSADKPMCAPNFYNKTGLFTISLYARWYKYPDHKSLGTATITGLKGKYKAPPVHPAPIKPPVPPPGMLEGYEGSKDTCSGNLSGAQVGGIAAGMVILFGVLLWISVSRKNVS